MNGVIVRNSSEIDAYLRFPAERSVFLATNQSTHQVCLNRSLRSFFLDEDLLRNEYRRMDDWVVEKASWLTGLFGSRPEYRYDLESKFYDLQTLFLSGLKTVLVLNKIRSEEPIQSLSVASYESDLALLVKSYAEYSQPVLDFSQFSCPPPPASFHFKSLVYVLAGAFSNAVAWVRLRCLWGRSDTVLASGALRHLQPLLPLLKKRGHRVIYCENGFNLERFLFCLKHGLIFLSLPGGARPRRKFPQPLFPEKSLVYEGRDLTGFFNSFFGIVLSRAADAFDLGAVDQLVSGLDVRAVLLDEDIDIRRCFASSAWHWGKPCKVVSHGVPGVSRLDQNRIGPGVYRHSDIFLNSEFEKWAYENTYHDPNRLFVTGLPRYDRIPALSAADSRAKGTKKTFLYCTGLFREWDFEQRWARMGCQDNMGERTRQYLDDILAVTAKDERIDLWVKIHSNEETQVERCIKKLPAKKTKVILYSHRADLLPLIAESDIVITPESTVICEALMLQKQVIVVNYAPREIPRPYREHGVIVEVKTKEGLADVIGKCMDDAAFLARWDERRRKAFRYFAGPLDGQSVHRILAKIA